MTPSSAGSGKTGSMALAQLIRDRRQQLGMSRQDLADAADIPYPTIAQIETGYRGVSPARLGTIARALGLDPKDMYEVLASDVSSDSIDRTRQSLTSAGRRDERAWHANPSYLVPPTQLGAVAADAVPAPPVPPPPPDVVERVVDLLSQLPAHERLDALTRVQSRLLSALVDEQVQQASRDKH
jgi:transcriptional regulator with XRE-family HTH domain